MSAVLMITLFVGSGLSGTPLVAAMDGALVEVVGEDAGVEVLFVDQPERRAEQWGRQGGRGVVAWIEVDESGLIANLHVRREGAAWQSRTIRFANVDAVGERGRAIGFVLAGIVRPEIAGAGPAPEKAPEPTSTPSSASPSTWAVEVLAMAALGLEGMGGGLGGGAGLRRTWASGLGLRLGAGVLTRSLDAGDAGALRLWSARASLGGTFARALTSSFVLGARLDALAAWETVAQTEGGERDRQGRVLPGAAALVEAAWKISPRVSIVGAAGLEAIFGHTSVLLDDRAIATLPPWRLTADVGVRLGL